MDQMNRAEQIAYINEHREATGHPLFKSLTDDQIKSHLALIDEFAAYGQDPWSGDIVCTMPSQRKRRATR
jgi:hypothetical protein